MKDLYFKSVAAGIAIAFGSTIYLSCESKVVGAILFALGLISVCYLNLNLYTGKIGYFSGTKDIKNLVNILIGNIIGAGIVALLMRVARPELIEVAAPMVVKKIGAGWHNIITGIFCGVIMYIAVELFKSKKTPLGILFGIPVFILSGFEHSIADACYMFYGVTSSAQVLGAVLMVVYAVIGNTIGSIVFRALVKEYIKK